MSRRKINIDKNYDDDSDEDLVPSKTQSEVKGKKISPTLSRSPPRQREGDRGDEESSQASALGDSWISQGKLSSRVNNDVDDKNLDVAESPSPSRRDSNSWKEAKPVHNYVYTRDKDEVDDDDDSDAKATTGVSSGSGASSKPAQDYFESAEKNGVVLPRASGRYYDEGPTGGDGGGGGPAQTQTERPSFNMIAHPRGTNTPLVQCVIIRKRSYGTIDLFPMYELRLENPNGGGDHQLLLVAIKQSMNKTSNYHFFDMTRGTIGQIFNKKSGNYIGKLRSISMSRLDFYLIGNNEAVKEEYAGITFEQESILSMSGGPKPRKVEVLIPKLYSDGTSISYKPKSHTSKMAHEGVHLCELLRSSNTSILEPSFHFFQNKEPEKHPDTGSYNLNFNGRVSAPSVKNFQLVSADNTKDIILQFGKVNEDRFHLDFKTPFNAFQALALAICQFDL